MTNPTPCPIHFPRPRFPEPEHLARRLRYVIDRGGFTMQAAGRQIGMTGGGSVKKMIESCRQGRTPRIETLVAMDVWLHPEISEEEAEAYWVSWSAMRRGPVSWTALRYESLSPKSLERARKFLRVALQRGWVRERHDWTVEGWKGRMEPLLWWCGWDLRSETSP